jgi:hypothetical protein
MKVYPCLSDAVHLVPSFFLLYVLSLAAPFFLPPNPNWALALLASPFWRYPIYLFFLLCFGTAISVISWDRDPLDIVKVPFLIFLRQIFYGIGLIKGLLSPIPKPNQGPVRLFRAVLKGKGHRLVEITPRKQS